jgi:hypothetical protein
MHKKFFNPFILEDLVAASNKIEAAYFMTFHGYGCIVLRVKKKKHLDKMMEKAEKFMQGEVTNIYKNEDMCSIMIFPRYSVVMEIKNNGKASQAKM